MTAHFKASPQRVLSGQDLSFPCSIGRGGVIEACRKREGDGASPVGTWTMKRVFWRADRLERPRTGLPVIALKPFDGWCDAPVDPLYNRPVRLPYPASHEKLWRDDAVYDIIVELDHNSSPVIPAAGSAIFLHIAKPDYADTEGCIALAPDHILEVLSSCTPGSQLEILDA